MTQKLQSRASSKLLRNFTRSFNITVPAGDSVATLKVTADFKIMGTKVLGGVSDKDNLERSTNSISALTLEDGTPVYDAQTKEDGTPASLLEQVLADDEFGTAIAGALTEYQIREIARVMRGN